MGLKSGRVYVAGTDTLGKSPPAAGGSNALLYDSNSEHPDNQDSAKHC